MARGTTRRTWSVRGELHETMRRLCKRDGVKPTRWVEELIEKELDRRGIKVLSRDVWLELLKGRKTAKEKRDEETAEEIGQHFTF